MDFRSAYLKVKVSLCEILVQCRGQVLDSSDYNIACEQSHYHPVPREDTHLHQVPEHAKNLQQKFLEFIFALEVVQEVLEMGVTHLAEQ